MLAVAEMIMLTIRAAYWIIRWRLCQCARPGLSGSMVRGVAIIHYRPEGQVMASIYVKLIIYHITSMSTLLHYTRGQLLSSINTTFNSEPPSLRRHVGNLQLGTMYFSHIVTQPLTEQALMMLTHLQIYLNQHYILSTPM